MIPVFSAAVPVALKGSDSELRMHKDPDCTAMPAGIHFRSQHGKTRDNLLFRKPVTIPVTGSKNHYFRGNGLDETHPGRAVTAMMRGDENICSQLVSTVLQQHGFDLSLEITGNQHRTTLALDLEHA
jgi:hypothetical protein